MVDVNAQIEAVTRGVQTMEVDGEPARVQTVAQTFPSPIDDVWDAVTSADRIARWFLPVSGDLRLGGRYQLEGNAGGEVQECLPPSGGAAHYRITWAYGGGARHVGDGPARGGLRRRDRARARAHREGRRRAGGAVGAVRTLGHGHRLGLRLPRPRAAPRQRARTARRPKQAMEWMMSDEGKAFTPRVRRRRGRPRTSRTARTPTRLAKAAEATYLMYTGQARSGMPEA